MSRLILLADLHIGARNANPKVCEYQINFFKKDLFPYMKASGINTIFQTGDVFDSRKFTNHFIIDLWKKEVFDYMEAEGISFHCILGNHDLFYKNKIMVNSPVLFLSSYQNVTIHQTPTDVEFDGTSFLALPWICDENRVQSLEKIKSSKSPIVIGHLELAKFEMHRGQLCDDGMDHTLFKKYEHVFSGHFHHKSDYGNISYLGCPYEFTWVDYNDPRGFHVFDTNTYDLKFVKSTDSLFYKFNYDDLDKGASYWKTFDVSNLKDKYVKLVVISKTDTYQYDRVLDIFYSAGCIDFKIEEDILDIGDDEAEDEVFIGDSMGLVDTYIGLCEFDGDKDKLKKLMKALYVESLAILE